MDKRASVDPGAATGFDDGAPIGVRRGWHLALTAGAVLGIGALVACRLWATGGDANEQLILGAQLAQQQCYRLIHHDTFEYRDCLRSLLAVDNLPTPKRLGVEYFGWAGAVNSARLGMKGAKATTFEFLHRFRATQKALGIDDGRLCAAVPGNCDTRLALVSQMEAAPPSAEPSGDEETSGEGQDH